jgi:hypothetical protein
VFSFTGFLHFLHIGLTAGRDNGIIKQKSRGDDHAPPISKTYLSPTTNPSPPASETFPPSLGLSVASRHRQCHPSFHGPREHLLGRILEENDPSVGLIRASTEIEVINTFYQHFLSPSAFRVK